MLRSAHPTFLTARRSSPAQRALVTVRLGMALLASGVVVLACGVDERGGDTGGLGGSLGLGGAPACPPALAVILSDYASTQVALVDPDGRTESESLISTASSRTDGLAFALSGDVVLPGSRTESGRVVLLDRYGTNVVTFVDPFSGRVLDQLSVGTGFDSNPHDYLEVGDKAFVARFGQNTQPGREPFDDGGDLLVLEKTKPRIRGQIRMPTWDDLPSRATALSLVEGDLAVTLARISLDFRTTGSAALAWVSPEDELLKESFDLAPYKNCSRAMLSPNGERFALVCSGALDQTGQVEDASASGILVFSATSRSGIWGELPASELGYGPLQPDGAFFSDDVLLVKTQTELNSSENNRLLAVDLRARTAAVLLEAAPDSDGDGQGVVYGGLYCPAPCPGVCLLADADEHVLQRVGAGPDGTPELLEPLGVEDRVGLPPIALAPL